MLHCLRISHRRNLRSKSHLGLPGCHCCVSQEELFKKKKVMEEIMMEEANEPARTIGPALAKKTGTEVGWVTLLD